MQRYRWVLAFCLTIGLGWTFTSEARPPTSRPTKKRKRAKKSKSPSLERHMLNVWKKRRRRRIWPRKAPTLKFRRKKPSTKWFRSKGMSKSEIARVIRRKWNAFRRCYEDVMQKHPKAWDTLILIRWIINSKGRVSAASVVKATGNSDTLEQCLVREIKKLKFPKPRSCGVVVVTYPFRVCLVH